MLIRKRAVVMCLVTIVAVTGTPLNVQANALIPLRPFTLTETEDEDEVSIYSRPQYEDTTQTDYYNASDIEQVIGADRQEGGGFTIGGSRASKSSSSTNESSDDVKVDSAIPMSGDLKKDIVTFAESCLNKTSPYGAIGYSKYSHAIKEEGDVKYSYIGGSHLIRNSWSIPTTTSFVPPSPLVTSNSANGEKYYMDCSSFIVTVYKDTNSGFYPGGSTREQAAFGTKITYAEVEVGDLLIDPGNHVVLAISNTETIEVHGTGDFTNPKIMAAYSNNNHNMKKLTTSKYKNSYGAYRVTNKE